MARAYLHPRRSMERQLAAGLSEGRGLFHLMVGCLLLCAASAPEAIRTAASLPVDEPANAAIAARIFGYMILLPVLCYGLAALLHLFARPFGGQGSGLAARSALFWSILLGGPVALLLAVVSATGVVPGGTATDWPAVIGLGFWLWLASAALGASERLRTAGVLAALGFFIAVIAFATEILI
jgi:hypothetical protein